MPIMHAAHYFHDNNKILGENPTALPRNEQLLWNINAGMIQLVQQLEQEISGLRRDLQQLQSRLH